MDLFPAVGDDAYYDLKKDECDVKACSDLTYLLPRVGTPGLARLSRTKMRNVLHDAIKCSCEEDFILTVTIVSGGLELTDLGRTNLYIVMTTMSSVGRPAATWRSEKRFFMNASGSHVTAVYLKSGVRAVQIARAYAH